MVAVACVGEAAPPGTGLGVVVVVADAACVVADVAACVVADVAACVAADVAADAAACVVADAGSRTVEHAAHGVLRWAPRAWRPASFAAVAVPLTLPLSACGPCAACAQTALRAAAVSWDTPPYCPGGVAAASVEDRPCLKASCFYIL